MPTFLHPSTSPSSLTELPPRLLLRGGGTNEEGRGRGSTRRSSAPSGGDATEEPGDSGIRWEEREADSDWVEVGSPRSSVTRVEGGRGSLVFSGADTKAVDGGPTNESTRSRHRGRALYAGLLTLVVLGYTVWITFEAVYAVVRLGGTGRGVVRWVEVGVGSVAVVGCGICIVWLKTRRPSHLSVIALISSSTTILLHTFLAISNVVLIFVFQSEVEDRCTWGLDYSWDLGDSGMDCKLGEQTTWGNWVTAGFVRLALTVFIGIIWNILLLRFKSSLLPSPSPPLSPSPTSRPNHLPSMPSRSHRILPSESSIAFEDTLHSNSSSMWFKSKFWGAIGFAIGIESFEAHNGRKTREREGEKMLLRMGRGSENLPGQRLSGLGIIEREGSEEVRQPRDLDDPLDEEGGYAERRRRETYPPSPSDSISLSPGSVWQRSPGLSDDTCGTSIEGYSSMDPRVLSYSSSPPPSPSPSPLPISYSSSISSNDSYKEPRSPFPFEPPPPQLSFLGEPTGSSGSSGGSLIYVRMSDGRLVRKLSTIASIAEQESISGAGAGGGGEGRGLSGVGREGEVVGWEEVERGVKGWREMLPRGGSR